MVSCQKRRQSNGRTKMNAKASLLPLKQESLCVRKWSTSEKANMAHARLSRQSPLACPRHGGPEWSYLHQREEKRERSVRLNGSLRRDAHAKNRPPGVRAQANARSSAKAAARRRREHCRNTPNGWQSDAQHGLVRHPRRRPLAHVNDVVDMTPRFAVAQETYAQRKKASAASTSTTATWSRAQDEAAAASRR